MHAGLAHHRQIRRHFRGIVRWDVHRFAAHQDIERAGIKDDLSRFGMQFFPKVFGGVGPNPIQVYHPCVGFGAISHECAFSGSKINRKPKPIFDDCLAIHKRVGAMQLPECGIIQNSLARAEPDLIKPHSRTNAHREGAWADLGIERTRIPRWDTIKLNPIVRDQAREEIEPPGRAFGIGHSGEVLRKIQRFHERHNINCAFFEDRARVEVNAMHFKLRESLRHAAPATRQKRCAHAIGHAPKPQVEAGRLDLSG